jgi:hypothetical protein
VIYFQGLDAIGIAHQDQLQDLGLLVLGLDLGLLVLGLDLGLLVLGRDLGRDHLAHGFLSEKMNVPFKILLHLVHSDLVSKVKNK